MDTDMDTVKGTVKQLVDNVGATCKYVNHKLQVLTESSTKKLQIIDNTIGDMVKENAIMKRELRIRQETNNLI